MAEQAQRPWAIKSRHLNRKALLYLRQSSMHQVQMNEGSTMHQRDQAQFPKDWGFPDGSIEVIAEDLGRSGSSTIHRAGYQRLYEMVIQGLVGAIFVAYLDRIGRNVRESMALLDECRNHHTLLVCDGRILDPRDRSDYFQALILLGVAELENSGRRDTLYNGKLAKAKRGIAVSPPPVGYVSERGLWLKDPDELVRIAVETVFRLFREMRSLLRSVTKMIELGLKLPRRRGHSVYWVDPTISAVAFMLRNPSYAGDYVFRQRRTDPALGRSPNGRLRDRVSADDEVVVISNHHEPYVTREHFAEVRHIMAVNAPRKDRRNLGPGKAILQGILRCSVHTTAIGPRFKTREGRAMPHSYYCQGYRWKGGEGCGGIPGRGIDAAVAKAIADRLDPPALVVLREAWKEALAALGGEDDRRRLEGERLRRVVADLKRRFFEVGPQNRRLAIELESMLERALRELEEFEVRASEAHPSVPARFSDDAFADLIEICAGFEGLWNAPTTQPRDRKEIVRTLIKSVVVDISSDEEVNGHIVWVDGTPDTPINVKLPAYAARLMIELSMAGVAPAEIAARLNAEGLTNLRSNAWTEKMVKQRLWMLQSAAVRKQAVSAPTE